MSFLESTGNLDVDTIMAMHRYMRPKGSRTEQAFIKQFIEPLGAKDDTWGNYHLTIGENPVVLWSSHTDTVHHLEGFQQVSLDDKGILKLNKKSKSNCLGADDGAGVWLMTEMIKAKVPGLYIFHYGEEKGCEGSTAIAQKAPEILKGIKIAVAFDRKDFGDVITHISSRICSETFANSLIAQLPEGYKICDSGMRTDIKLYEKLVDECVNISVGYTFPHSASESLDVHHLIKLRNYLTKIDVSKLKVTRDKTITEYKSVTHTTTSRHATSYDSYYTNTPRTLHDILDRHGATVADMMARAGVKFEDLMHLVIEEQKRNPKTWTYREPKLTPPAGWKSPYAVEVKTETKTEAKADSGGTDKTPQVPDTATMTPLKDVAPHHINTPGATDAVSPSRGGGAPNPHPMRTGNPAHDQTPRHRHHLGSE